MTIPITPEEIEGFQPDRLWSLWDMVANFLFSYTQRLLGELTLLIWVSDHNLERVEALGARINSDPKLPQALKSSDRSVMFCADETERLLGGLKCGHINDATRRLRQWTKRTPQRWSELKALSMALRDAIHTEMREYLFYQYPQRKGEKLRAWKSEWQPCLTAFPNIESDAFSAVDCYALQHNTASVFHSMRVAEHGLRAIASERRIKLPKNRPLEWGSWQEIIRELDNEIKLIGGKKAGSTKDAALEFYSGARADLNGFKDEYRNLVMHVRANYDEFQALRALTNVHAFMARLATKLDHSHKRINWGRFLNG